MNLFHYSLLELQLEITSDQVCSHSSCISGQVVRVFFLNPSTSRLAWAHSIIIVIIIKHLPLHLRPTDSPHSSETLNVSLVSFLPHLTPSSFDFIFRWPCAPAVTGFLSGCLPDLSMFPTLWDCNWYFLIVWAYQDRSVIDGLNQRADQRVLFQLSF